MSNELNGNTVIEKDVRCFGCAYNLRGLRADGQCPECGFPVERSLAESVLIVQDEAYIRRVRTGVALTKWSFILLVFAPFLVAGVGANLTTGVGGAWAPWVSVAAIVLLFALWCAGWWRITTPEPIELSMRDKTLPRRLIRGAIFVYGACLVGAVAAFIVAMMNFGPAAPSQNARLAALAATGIVAGLFLVLISLALLPLGVLHLRRLATRARDAKARRRTTLLMIGSCVWLVTIGVAIGAAAMLPVTPQPVLWSAIGLTSFVLLCLIVILARGLDWLHVRLRLTDPARAAV